MTPPTRNAALTRLLAIGILAALATAGCKALPPAPETLPPLVALEPGDYPGFFDDADLDSLSRAIGQSLIYFDRVPEERLYAFGPDRYTAAHLRRSLERFRDFLATGPDPERLDRFVRQNYAVYRSPGRPPEGGVLFTGYFEPLYPGSIVPAPGYPVPVHGPPSDLIKVDLSLFSDRWSGERIAGRVDGNRLLPYHTRAEIVEQNALSGKAGVIAWMRDPVDLYILQVQGSGKLFTPSGETVRIQYADKNGRPARLVGGRLIEEGKIAREDMSLQAIRAYFRRHPEEVPRLLNADPSYVFFRRGEGGPYGNIGVELTPARSIATDASLFPGGALAYVETEQPVAASPGVVSEWVPLRRFVLNQDTGGLIKGPGRVDFFWGSGDFAETAAGHMKQPGRLYFLVLRSGDAEPGPAAGISPPGPSDPLPPDA